MRLGFNNQQTAGGITKNFPFLSECEQEFYTSLRNSCRDADHGAEMCACGNTLTAVKLFVKERKIGMTYLRRDTKSRQRETEAS